MRSDPADRCIPLAATLQACHFVHRLATEAGAETPGWEALISSVFTLDADDLAACYGGELAALRPGLKMVTEQLGERIGEPAPIRYLFGVLHLERKLSRRPQLLEELGGAIEDSMDAREAFGLTHANTIARLARVYSETIGQLSPRIMVSGNVQLLQDSPVVNRIRALLLSAMRSAVLWRQVGGRRWHLVLRRRAIAEHARAWQSVIGV